MYTRQEQSIAKEIDRLQTERSRLEKYNYSLNFGANSKQQEIQYWNCEIEKLKKELRKLSQGPTTSRLIFLVMAFMAGWTQLSCKNYIKTV